ncbi:alpha/beta fold hydrolase [Rhizobacter fulvus]
MTTPCTWVLLRGWTRDARHWLDVGDRLAAASPAARVLAIDLPGTGQVQALRSPWTVRAMAQHVRGALRAAGAEPPYALLAVSMGGMVATAWANEWPDEIDAAVLVNTSMRPFSPAWQRLRPSAYGRLMRALVSGAAATEHLILQLTSRLRADDAALLRRWTAQRIARPVRPTDALAQLVAAASFSAPRRNPFRHVLLLTSACDELVDTRCTLALARAWQCEVRSHPHAGHDLPLDDPQWVVTQTASLGHGVITKGRHDAGS